MRLGLPGVALGALTQTSLPGELMNGGSYSWRRRRRNHLQLATLDQGQDLWPQPPGRRKLLLFSF